MRRPFTFLSVVFVVSSFFAVQFPSLSHSDVPTQKVVLNNGLTVLVSEMPASSTVSLYGLVKTGSATEGKYLGTGISHFLEHMLFKGTEKRGVGQIANEVQALGGNINASTSFDYTIYTLTLPYQAFEQGLDILSDMLMNSTFDADELEKEREVVYAEMQMYRDRPDRVLSQMVFETVYKQHPYGIPIIGHEELLRGLKRDDFVDYYRTHYVPDNMIISIAGRVETPDVLEKVRAAFEGLKRKPLIARNLVPEPPQINYRFTEREYPTELTRASLSYAGVPLRDPDLYTLDVLAAILGQGESSRLHKELFLKRKLVRSIQSWNFTPLDRGVFEIRMLLDEKDLSAAIDAVKEQIRLIASKGVDVAELEKVKRQVRSQHVFSRLTSDVVANSAAADEAFTGDHRFSEKYVEAIGRVTAADIKRAAQRYFNDDSLSLVVLKPAGQKKVTEAARSERAVPEIQKFVLSNGLTILIRENKTFPVVSVAVVMNAGSWQEPEGKSGLSEITSRLLNAGTKRRSSEEIASSVESRGASLSPFSGRNSMGLTMNMLVEDLDFGLSLVEDIVKNSVFPDIEIDRQKTRLYTAQAAQEDNVGALAGRHLRQTLFAKHPFRNETIGTKESVGAITRTDIMDFYSRHAVAPNMVISVFGHVEAEAVLKVLSQKFGGLPAGQFVSASFEEPPPSSQRERTVHADKKQAVVMVGFQGPDFKSPDRDGVSVLTSLLGSSFNGRIFRTIRDEFGGSYALGGSYTPARDMGLISFYVLTNEEQADDVKKMLLKIIEDVAKNSVEEQELEDMKNYIKGSFQMGIETDSSLAFMVSLDEVYGIGHDFYKGFNERVDAVTVEDVRALARKYLDLNKAAVVILRPQGQGQ